MASTRLTNAMRDEFVRKVMTGIPIKHPFDIHDVEEQIAKEIEANLPADIKSFGKKHPDLLTRNKRVYYPEEIRGCAYGNYVLVIDREECAEIDCSKYLAQRRGHNAEKDERAALQAEIESVARACPTVEKLEQALPELKTYMPSPTSRQLPIAVPTDVVVANLMRAGLKVPAESASST